MSLVLLRITPSPMVKKIVCLGHTDQTSSKIFWTVTVAGSAKILNVETSNSENEETSEWMTSEKICFTVRLLFFNFFSFLVSDRFLALSAICVKICRKT